MGSFKQIVHKYSEKYVNAMLILTMDALLSLIASFFALLVYNCVQNTNTVGSAFIFTWVGVSFAAALICFYLTRTFRIVVRHSSMREMLRFFVSLLIRLLIVVAIITPIFTPDPTFLRILMIGLFDAAILLVLIVLSRASVIYILDSLRINRTIDCNRTNLFVYGTGDKSVSLITRLQHSSQYKIVGFVSYGEKQVKYMLAELPILHVKDCDDLKKLCSRYDTNTILFPIESAIQKEKERLIPIAAECGVKIMVAPSVDEVIDGKINHSNIRQINIEDLLGRPEIQLSMDEIIKNFQDKIVMVTGAAGSIGSELCRQLAGFGIKRLILFDNAETPTHYLRLQLEEKFPNLDFVPVIGDVRSKVRLDFAFRKYRPQVVFHAAAYKHVPLMEENPCEAVFVNVTGSHYVANKCIEYGVEKMVMVSTDKAVNPTNVMGCTKRMAEIYVQSLGLSIAQGKHEGTTKFVTTRFGNVLGSNGSVIPRFREQIEKGGPLTVTHPEIIRFFMTIPEACRLVMEAATMSKGNEIFVFEMGKPVKIADMARRMIELAGFVPDKDIKIEFTGLRPGEKLYEEVLANAENTIPTNHQRIKIAKVREYDYTEAHAVVNRLTQLAANVQIPEMIHLLKETVPEFHSTNPEYQKY